MQTSEIIEVISRLPVDEQRRIAEEVLRHLEEKTSAERQQAMLSFAGSLQHFPDENTGNFPAREKRNAKSSPEFHTGWSETSFRDLLLDPDDEKNIQRIWKSPGGC